MWWHGRWADTPIFEQDDVAPGTRSRACDHRVPGDTFAIPPGRTARLDRNRIFHLET